MSNEQQPKQLKDIFTPFGDRLKYKQKLEPIPFFHSELNKALDEGMLPGLYFVNGGTGSGKTQFAIQTALKALEEGFPVLYVSLELDEHEMFARLFCANGKNGSWVDVLKGKNIKEEALDSFYKEIQWWPFYLICPSILEKGFDLASIPSFLKEHQQHHSKRFLVIVDFLQLIGVGENVDIRQRIQKASYGFKAIANKTRASFLILSAVARSWYDTNKTEPKEENATSFVGTGKESGEIEYSANAVLFMHSESNQIGIAKNRYGQAGKWFNNPFSEGVFEPNEREEEEIIA